MTCGARDGSWLAAARPNAPRTLRAAIGWSHELCTPSERLLWAGLSVFTGPFGLRDATDVCGATGRPPRRSRPA
jgi:predicted ATPase